MGGAIYSYTHGIAYDDLAPPEIELGRLRRDRGVPVRGIVQPGRLFKPLRKGLQRPGKRKTLSQDEVLIMREW